MISIIICSRSSDVSPLLCENIQSSIGVDYEIIVIDNSQNNYSIFSAYNEGFKRSKYPYLCFVHEDVMFRTANWGGKLVNHLQNKQTGIIGVAGGQVTTRIPAPWWSTGIGYKNLIQHYNGKNQGVIEQEFNDSTSPKPVVALDGVFLSFRRDLFQEIKFDEKMDGFHGYDIDISMQSILAGYMNYVVFDILIEHFSQGNMNAQYYENLIQINKKWKNHLPIFSKDVTEDNKRSIESLEIKLLGKLIRRMSRTGFRTSEIIDIANYYANILNTNKAYRQLKFIRMKILFEKIFHSS